MACLFVTGCWVLLAGEMASGQSANTPLVLPSGLAFDAGGNLYFAESGNHVVRRLSGGVLTVVAGTGEQGFAGDGGLATAAMLDSPEAVAVDAAGDLFVADMHNHCVRRVDAGTGVISTVVHAGLPVALAMDGSGGLVYADASTHQVMRVDPASGVATVVAGSGLQGFSGDGGAATSAALDTPSGLAFDAAGDLFLADTHNHRVRRVDAGTGVITTVAGNGQPGFWGDAMVAGAARLTLPRGLIVDGSGNLLIADSSNHRVRRVDAVTGVISTIAGDGSQGFAGDGSAAVAASLDSPRSVAISNAGLVTTGDRGNNRVRQVNVAADLSTIAGAGAVGTGAPTQVATASSLTQNSMQSVKASVTATAGTPVGNVTLVDATTAVETAALSGGSATFATSGLSAGSHTLTAVYAGSGTFLASTSPPLVVTIGATSTADFTLASSGVSAATIAAGSSASYAFLVTPTGSAPLSSVIQLTTSGLPAGAIASFAPAYLPPPSGPVSFTMSVSVPVKPASHNGTTGGVAMALLLSPLVLFNRRRSGYMLFGLVLLAGCGDRINRAGESGVAVSSYTITVNATGTSSSGGTLLHSSVVTLAVQ